MDATKSPPLAAEPVDTLALVRRIRDDFATRTAGLPPDALIALIRREAGTLRPEPAQGEGQRAAA